MAKLMLIFSAIGLFWLMMLMVGIECASRRPKGSSKKNVWPFEENCGRHKPLKLTNQFHKNPRAGGFDVMVEYFPSFAQFGVTGKDGKHWTCPGVLLSDRHVMTHDRCFYPAKSKSQLIKVTLGLGSKSEKEFEAVGCPIGRHLVGGLVADQSVRVFKLKKRAKYDENIQPACLFKRFDNGIGPIGNTGLNESTQAYLVLDSTVTDINSDKDPEEEEEEEDGKKKPQRLRVVPVKKTSCRTSETNLSRICMKPNLRKFKGSVCKDDYGAPLLATIDGKHEVLGLLKPHFNRDTLESHEATCQEDKPEIGEYLVARDSSNYIARAASQKCPK